MTEKELRAVTIGEPVRLAGKVRIVEYDPAWPGLFRREAGRVRAALGNKALRIKHVGSTSVPGLPAKPIIDMLLVVADSADEKAYVPAMEEAGYTLRIREPHWHEHRLFKSGHLDINLHVFSAGSTEIENMLVFRDWLRVNPSDKALYLRTKRALARKDWKYMQNYADAKATVVKRILKRARAWAAAERERQ